MFWFKKRRRARLASQQFPEEWSKILENNVPLYTNLPMEDKAELRRHILVFIGEKRFEGCGGLMITDEIKVTIAAQACVLLLHRKTDYYPGVSSVLVYPQAFVAPRARHLASGVVAKTGEPEREGKIILTVVRNPYDRLYSIFGSHFARLCCRLSRVGLGLPLHKNPRLS